MCDTFVKEFNWPVRVYYEDTDSGGVVYYANYLKFMERARTEWLRHFGLEQDALRDQFGIIFAVRKVQIDYILPAIFNDELIVTAGVIKKGKASINFAQTITRNNDLLSTAEIKIACLDAELFKPVSIPQQILENLSGD